VRKPTRSREVGRGERVLPGVWRLRLPLSLPGVPHCNAWALAAGDGIVLVDTGMHEPGSMGHLERALDQTGWRVEDVRLVVITHAHIDHCGQAPPIAARAGCEVWLHPAHAHHTASMADPDAAFARRLEIAAQSGVPEAALRRWAERHRGGGTGQAGELRADRALLPGVEVRTEVGTWEVVETPGHAPSHVCLHLPERRLLISGDHLLGRVSQYFDLGATPDPVGEFLHSLDVVETLDARLALSGHGRPFTDVPGHIRANRELVATQLAAVREALAGGARSAYAVTRAVYGERFTDTSAGWLMTMGLAWLTHLARRGEVVRTDEKPVERWAPAP
jgi:glyoxylase-like metal-dependent hydrolase (beta-lactamase superfamily II)